MEVDYKTIFERLFRLWQIYKYDIYKKIKMIILKDPWEHWIVVFAKGLPQENIL